MSRVIWLVLPFIFNLAYLSLLIPADPLSSLSLLVGITSAIFILIYVLHHILRKSKPTFEQTTETESSYDERRIGQNPILILSGIYGVVAGFAITTALQSAFVPLVGQPRSPLDLVSAFPNEFWSLFIFLSIAVPFYHGTSMFLVKIAREGIKKGTEGKTFFDFVVLFVEASLLIAMGLTLNSFHAFTGWITLLIIVDASWLFISLAKKDYSAPIEWLQLDIPFILFLVLIPNFFTPELQFFTLLILLAISVLRSAIDYKIAWRSIYFPLVDR
jgi:hypothetical protein